MLPVSVGRTIRDEEIIVSWHAVADDAFDEVLSPTGLFDVSYIVRKRRLGLFGHVARLRSDVPANQILRICTKTRDGDRPSQQWRRASGRPPTTWIHQICRDTGVTTTGALQLAEDRPFWRTIATAGGFGWSLRVTSTTTTTPWPVRYYTTAHKEQCNTEYLRELK